MKLRHFRNPGLDQLPGDIERDSVQAVLP